MASWVETYDAIRFQVSPYKDGFALWRVRLLKDKVVYRAFMYRDPSKEALEQDARRWQAMCAAINPLYR